MNGDNRPHVGFEARGTVIESEKEIQGQPLYFMGLEWNNSWMWFPIG